MDFDIILVLVFINCIASSKGTVTVTESSGTNAVAVLGTLTLRCTISSLEYGMFWSTPGSGAGTACFCSSDGSDCLMARLDNRVTCSSDVSSKQFTLTVTDMGFSDEGRYTCRHSANTQEERTLVISVQVPITSVDVISPTSSPVIVSENSPSTFVCETSAGRPQATITWYKQLGTNTALPVSGGSITTTQSGTSVKTRSTLQYTPIRTDHDYRVYCIAYNIDASSTFSSTNNPQLYVQYAPDSGPVIESQPSGSTLYILDGKPHNLACSINGGRPLASLSWNCFSGVVQNQSTGTTAKQQVTWTAARAHDRQRCTCLATHPVWTSMRQHYVTIEALYPPTSPIFTVQSQPVTSTVSVIEGSGVSLTCNSTSNPLPVYSWNPRGSSTNSNILTLTSVSTSNDGVYTCTVTNTMTPTQGSQESGSNSASITFNVLFPPRTPVLRYNTTDGPILISAFNVVRGDSFSIYCNAEGNPLPYHQWTSQSTNNNKLTVTDIQTDTLWTCTATNDMVPSGAAKQTGSSTTTATANVLYSASITEFNINGAKGTGPLIYNENTTLTVVCVVDSKPGSAITIYRDGSIIRTAANTNELTHTVNEASCLDAGIYACTAGNQYNGKAIPTIQRHVFIRCPPMPFDSVNNYTYYYALNERVTLNLTVTAFPEPTFRWYRHIVEITTGVSENSHQTNLTIDQLTQDDFGQYKVVVSNSQGTLEHLFFLVAQGPPDNPVGFMLIRELRVPTFVWEKGNNGGINQTFIIEVSREGTNQWTPTLHINEWGNGFRLQNGFFIADIWGLDPGSYLARIMSKNNLGSSNALELVSPFLVIQTSKCAQDYVEQSPAAGIATGVISGIEAIAITALIIYILRHKHIQRKDTGEEKQSAKGEPNIELQETGNSESPYLNIESDAALNEQHKDETRNAYERLDPAMKKDELYDAMETREGSNEQHADTTRNVYEKLDPALTKDGLYEAMETRKDECKQDNGEEYVNLNV